MPQLNVLSLVCWKLFPSDCTPTVPDPTITDGTLLIQEGESEPAAKQVSGELFQSDTALLTFAMILYLENITSGYQEWGSEMIRYHGEKSVEILCLRFSVQENQPLSDFVYYLTWGAFLVWRKVFYKKANHTSSHKSCKTLAIWWEESKWAKLVANIKLTGN